MLRLAGDLLPIILIIICRCRSCDSIYTRIATAWNMRSCESSGQGLHYHRYVTIKLTRILSYPFPVEPQTTSGGFGGGHCGHPHPYHIRTHAGDESARRMVTN